MNFEKKWREVEGLGDRGRWKNNVTILSFQEILKKNKN